VLAALAAMAAFCIAVTLSPLASSNAYGKPTEGDVALYRAEVERVRAGEGFYDASAAELTARGYPTRSVFNWRTPLPMWLLGIFPDLVFGKVLLGALGLALFVLAFEVLAREEPGTIRRAAACALLLTGPLMFTVLDSLCVVPGLWAAILIGLSVCAYGLNRPYWGVALGVAALFFRELAMPYCLVAVGLALWHRRRGELLAWAAGLALWGLFFLNHVVQVTARIPEDAWALEQSWIQFGGAAFVIATVQMNAYLLVLPQWVSALYFVAAMFGLAGWHTPLGKRVGLTVCLFVIGFAVVGQQVNQYWGELIAPLLCFGVARFPASLRDLCHAARVAGREWPVAGGA
jgi:hypothetical protein